MADDSRNRLNRKRDELIDFRELCYKVHGRIGFKILSSSGGSYPQEVWQFLSVRVIPGQEKTTPVPVEAFNNWIEPFPGGSQCFWWWGKAKAIEQFCQWAEETFVVLWEFRNELPEFSSGKGHFQTLRTFCDLALTHCIGDPPLVEERVLLDCPTLQPAQLRILPLGLRQIDPPPSFNVLDVTVNAPAFCLEVLDFLLGKVPHFVVDVAGQCVHYMGATYPVSLQQAHWLNLLNQNRGKLPLTQKACINACPQLSGGHFERLRNKLPMPLRALVKSKPGQGWWLE